MLELKEYLDGACKIMCQSGFSYLLKDDDAISHVAHFMMKADNQFDGTGSIEGFRYSYAKFGIFNYLRGKKNVKKSLDFNLGDRVKFSDTISSNFLTPYEQLEQKDFIQHILSADYLSFTQQKCLRMRYIEGLKLKDIGAELGITKQAVDQQIKSAITKIKERNYV